MATVKNRGGRVVEVELYGVTNPIGASPEWIRDRLLDFAKSLAREKKVAVGLRKKVKRSLASFREGITFAQLRGLAPKIVPALVKAHEEFVLSQSRMRNLACQELRDLISVFERIKTMNDGDEEMFPDEVIVTFHLKGAKKLVKETDLALRRLAEKNRVDSLVAAVQRKPAKRKQAR